MLHSISHGEDEAIKNVCFRTKSLDDEDMMMGRIVRIVYRLSVFRLSHAGWVKKDGYSNMYENEEDDL